MHCFSLSSPPVLEMQAVGTAAGGCYNLSRKKKDPFLFTLFLQKINKISGFEQVIFWLLPRGQWHSGGRGADFIMCPASACLLKRLLGQRNGHVDEDHH